ncbi:MAG: iron-containing alcohol dehydrogenase [Eubacteriales bacterium]|nr:iron-containing alcohol dehydrogenase [Eubacteriales bacterium]
MAFKELYQPVHTIIGEGCIHEIPRHINNIGVNKALIVTDEGLVKIGTVKMVTDVLDEAGKPYAIYSGVKPNPTVSIVNEAKKAYDDNGCDYVIGIGGGSPIDVAKSVGILATNGGTVEDYNGLELSEKPAAPIIAINTTAGTGSEVTRAFVVTDEVRKSKMLCVDSNSLAYLAINDPAMMVNMPPSLTAATGMDALTHSIEAFVANSRCPFTDGIALESIRLIGEYLERAVKDGKTDMEARTKMCWAQYMGGLAFSNAGLGMVHAMAHQLGGFYDTPHGVANAILLPYVMRFNLPKAADRYAEVAKAFGFNTAEMTEEQAAMAAIRFIEELKKTIKIPRLADTAFQPEDAKALALNAMKDTGMPENPRQPSVEEVIGVFYEAYLGE